MHALRRRKANLRDDESEFRWLWSGAHVAGAWESIARNSAALQSL